MNRQPRVPMPGFTCPEIDEIQEQVSHAVGKIEDYLADLSAIPRQLEELRSANDALRQWCAYWEIEATDQQVEIENLQNQLDTANNAILELGDTIASLTP